MPAGVFGTSKKKTDFKKARTSVNAGSRPRLLTTRNFRMSGLSRWFVNCLLAAPRHRSGMHSSFAWGIRASHAFLRFLVVSKMSILNEVTGSVTWTSRLQTGPSAFSGPPRSIRQTTESTESLLQTQLSASMFISFSGFSFV